MSLKENFAVTQEKIKKAIRKADGEEIFDNTLTTDVARRSEAKRWLWQAGSATKTWVGLLKPRAKAVFREWRADVAKEKLDDRKSKAERSKRAFNESNLSVFEPEDQEELGKIRDQHIEREGQAIKEKEDIAKEKDRLLRELEIEIQAKKDKFRGELELTAESIQPKIDSIKEAQQELDESITELRTTLTQLKDRRTKADIMLQVTKHDKATQARLKSLISGLAPTIKEALAEEKLATKALKRISKRRTEYEKIANSWKKRSRAFEDDQGNPPNPNPNPTEPTPNQPNAPRSVQLESIDTIERITTTTETHKISKENEEKWDKILDNFYKEQITNKEINDKEGKKYNHIEYKIIDPLKAEKELSDFIKYADKKGFYVDYKTTNKNDIYDVTIKYLGKYVSEKSKIARYENILKSIKPDQNEISITWKSRGNRDNEIMSDIQGLTEYIDHESENKLEVVESKKQSDGNYLLKIIRRQDTPQKIKINVEQDSTETIEDKKRELDKIISELPDEDPHKFWNYMPIDASKAIEEMDELARYIAKLGYVLAYANDFINKNGSYIVSIDKIPENETPEELWNRAGKQMAETGKFEKEFSANELSELMNGAIKELMPASVRATYDTSIKIENNRGIINGVVNLIEPVNIKLRINLTLGNDEYTRGKLNLIDFKMEKEGGFLQKQAYNVANAVWKIESRAKESLENGNELLHKAVSKKMGEKGIILNSGTLLKFYGDRLSMKITGSKK